MRTTPPALDKKPVSSPAAAAKAGDRRQRVQSVETGMAVLKGLSRLGGSASLTVLSQTIGENTAKVHRYLASLIVEGLVVQNPNTQHYHLGPEAVRIGVAALRQSDPVRLGEPLLAALRSELGVTCFIAIMGNMGPTVMRIEEPVAPVTINVRAGSVLPILWSATGRAFLGFSEDPSVVRSAEKEWQLASADQRALLGPDDPLQRLRRQVHEQGCATVHDAMLAGISAIAAPVFDAHGHLAAVLTALGSTAALDLRPGGRICPPVLKAAAQIGRAMGHTP